MKQISIFFICAILTGCYSSEPQKTGLEGKTMPSFKILLPDSTSYVDTKNIQTGKPIVLFYYGPYCPYSRAQMEEMLDEISSLKDVQVYAITIWPFVEMKKFYFHYQLSKYRNIIVGYDYNNFFGNYYKVTGVPFTAIYSKDKKMIKAFPGKIYTKQIIKAIEE